MTRTPRPKVPQLPSPNLDADARDWVPMESALWRIAATSGDHVLPWNGFRSFGPLPTMRWDPHLPPASLQPTRGVLYASPDLVTVVAEKFQKYRAVDPVTGAPYLYGFSPARPLILLDLTGDWPLRNGAAHALGSAPRVICRRYAAAILDRWPEADGLQCRSTMDGRVTVVLFPHAASALPRGGPGFARPLTQLEVYARVAEAAHQIGYPVEPID